ncbi:hypothetical protein ACTNDZ_12330 [Selenomonas montiformis]|uniref:hypothetical protein n=1 Tax=Selenomonas montiformis TaxID=2652285 RepID=UPI003F8A1261
MEKRIYKTKSARNKILALLCCFSFIAPMFSTPMAFADDDEDKAKQEKLDKLNSEYNNINTAAGVVGGLIGGDTGQLVTTAGQIANAVSHSSVIESTTSTASSSVKGVGGAVQGLSSAMSAPGALNNMGNDPIGSSQDLVSIYSSYATGGASAAASVAGDYLSVMGSVFGQKVSESITYRSVGQKGKYVCDSSTKNPTVDENVSINCIGVPTAPNTWIVAPSISFNDMPSSGGKYRKVGAGTSITYHGGKHPWLEVLPIALEVEYNVYEGKSTMSDDAFYSQYGDYNGNDFYSLDGTDYNDYLKNFYGDDSSSNFYSSSGILTDATAGYMFNNNSSYDYEGNSASSDWSNGTNIPNSTGGTNWTEDINSNGSFYDTDIVYASTKESGASDSYNADASAWNESNGNSELDMTSSDVNNYFSDRGYSSDSMGGISEDLFGNTDFVLDGDSDNLVSFSSGSEVLNDILDNGGYTEANGSVYNAEGDLVGHIKGPNVEFSMGSPELDGILSNGGYIDEYGNVHDSTGAIVGHVTSATAAAQEYKDYMDDQSTISKFLSNMQNLFAGASGEQGFLDSLTDRGGESMLDSLKSTFGLDDSSSVKKNTMSPQDMYKVAANILKKFGYTDEDIAKGVNYDGNSAYSQPDVAWDLNRITTLQKSFKIDVKMGDTAKKSSLGTSTSRYKKIQK